VKKSKKIALSAIMASLGTVILYVGSLLEVLDITSACIASFLVLFCLIEIGAGSALGVYATVTILSLLVLPQRLPALFFALFFGILPLTKMLFEKIGTRIGVILSYVLKLALFNGELVIFGIVAKELMNIPDSALIIAAYAVLSNAMFVLVDILYGVLTRMYFGTFRKRISKFLK